jgi:hypothetical protein
VVAKIFLDSEVGEDLVKGDQSGAPRRNGAAERSEVVQLAEGARESGLAALVRPADLLVFWLVSKGNQTQLSQ